MVDTGIKEAPTLGQENEEQSSFSFQALLMYVLLYWKWIIFSVVLCLGVAFAYLRYTPKQYSTAAKVLIKDKENASSRMTSAAIESLGMMGASSNFSSGFDNELLVISSNSMACEVVRKLKLYVDYIELGRIGKSVVYKDSPILADMDSAHLDTLSAPVEMIVENQGNGTLGIEGKYYYNSKKVSFEESFNKFPHEIKLPIGNITLTRQLEFDLPYKKTSITIYPILSMAYDYLNRQTIEAVSKTTTVANISLTDKVVERAQDYIRELVVVYNQLSNDDKNEVARKTDEFINDRLISVSRELDSTEDELKNYKKKAGLFDVQTTASVALTSSQKLDDQLVELTSSIEVINSLIEFTNNPKNKYKVIPAGLADASTNAIIQKHNDAVLERNRRLRSSAESSALVLEATDYVDGYEQSVKMTLRNTLKTLKIQKANAEKQYNDYAAKVSQAPAAEKVLASITRQQEVKSGLYLMLLQKREENAIQLAATADKAKMIEEPLTASVVSPKSKIIMLAALILGLAIPFGIVYVINLLRYKIEGRNDIEKLTLAPCIADIPYNDDLGDGERNVVVRENQNNTMEESFRSLRTNLQFVLAPGEKVILLTSSISGEGKTCISSNLAVSLSLMQKKVLILGLDIRKPQLAKLFNLPDKKKGITSYLAADKNDIELLDSLIQKYNNNLDVIAAGIIPPNPGELLARENLEVAIEHFKKKYDYILLDTAPVGLVSDTMLITRYADCVLYTCRADYTPKSCFDLINAMYTNDKVAKFNLVLNGVDMRKKKYGYYYGYGVYGKYGYGRNSKYGHYGYGRYGSYGGYGTHYGYGQQNDNKTK